MLLKKRAYPWRKIYHDVWADVSKRFFDRVALAHWSDWEHCHDGDIHDRESARRYIDKMLSSLGDRYTYLLTDEEATQSEGKEHAREILVASEDLDDGIGYLGIQSFGQFDIVDQLEVELSKIAHLRGFIVKLSGNTGGYFNSAVNCLELMVGSGPIIVAEEQTPDGICRSRVWFTEGSYFREVIQPDGSKDLSEWPRRKALIAGKPLVLIIDQNTMSAAEMVAGALLYSGRGGRVIAIGAKSHGKGIGQSTYTYDHGIVVKISQLRVLVGDGVWIGDCGRTVANGIEPSHCFGEFVPAVRFAFQHLKENIAGASGLASSRVQTLLAH